MRALLDDPPSDTPVSTGPGPDVEVEAVPSGQVARFTARSPARETGNEDCLAVVPFGPSATVLAVADGVGGSRGGAEASRRAIEALAESVRDGFRSGATLRAAVLDGFERANLGLLERGEGATTLAVVEIDDGHARAYHVGDSLALVVGQRGRVKHRTTAHGPVGYGIEAGLIDDQDALHHADLHLVSNVVGSRDMRIEIGPRRALAPRDTVLLASDGLTDNLYLDEIVETVRRGPLRRAAARLAARAGGRMAVAEPGRPHKPDDLTFVLFRLRPTLPAV